MIYIIVVNKYYNIMNKINDKIKRLNTVLRFIKEDLESLNLELEDVCVDLPSSKDGNFKDFFLNSQKKYQVSLSVFDIDTFQKSFEKYNIVGLENLYSFIRSIHLNSKIEIEYLKITNSDWFFEFEEDGWICSNRQDKLIDFSNIFKDMFGEYSYEMVNFIVVDGLVEDGVVVRFNDPDVIDRSYFNNKNGLIISHNDNFLLEHSEDQYIFTEYSEDIAIPLLSLIEAHPYILKNIPSELAVSLDKRRYTFSSDEMNGYEFKILHQHLPNLARKYAISILLNGDYFYDGLSTNIKYEITDKLIYDFYQDDDLFLTDLKNKAYLKLLNFMDDYQPVSTINKTKTVVDFPELHKLIIIFDKFWIGFASLVYGNKLDIHRFIKLCEYINRNYSAGFDFSEEDIELVILNSLK